MTKTKARRGISKADWLEIGLLELSKGGANALTIEGLAKSLGINKSGFYWHFKNRKDLLNHLLDFWTHELTEVVTENQDFLSLDPRSRLIKTAEMIMDYELTRYDMAFRQWARQDTEAAQVVRKVNRLRMNFIRNAFVELGFKGDDLEMRTMLFTCYHSLESAMFPEISIKRRREQISNRIDLLISKKSR